MLSNFYQIISQPFVKPAMPLATRPVRLGRASWLGLSLALALSISVADFQLRSGGLVFYPPEFLIYVLMFLTLVSANARQQLKAAWFALPVVTRQAIGFILVGSLVATVVSPLFPTSLGALKAWIIAPMLLFGLTVAFVDSEAPLIQTVVWLSLILAAVGLWQLSHGGLADRLTAYYQSPNYFAALAAPLGVILIWLGLKRHWRFLVLGLLLLTLVALAKSLGAFLGVGAAALVGWFSLGSKARWAVALGLLILIIGLAPILGERLSHRQNSLTSRVQMWEAGALMGSTWPVTGAGLRGYEARYPDFIVRVTPTPQAWDAAQPHNFYLALWLGLGLFGLLGFIWLFWQLVPSVGRPGAFQLALVAILAHGLVDTPYFRVDLSLMLWLYFAAVIVSRQSLEEHD